jgi:hypothetical protein
VRFSPHSRCTSQHSSALFKPNASDIFHLILCFDVAVAECSTPLPPATVRTVLTSLLLLNTPRMHNNNRHCNNNNKSSRRDTNTTFHAGTLTTSPSLLSLPHVALFWWKRVSLWALCPQSHSPRHEYVIIYLWSHERCRFYRSNSNTAGTNHLILFFFIII